MKMKSLRIIIWLVFSAAFMEQGYVAQNLNMAKLKWIDLTYPFSAKTLYWPNNPTGFVMDTMFEGKTDKGFYYSSYSLCAPEHGGTHLDAPVHFAEGKKTVEQLTLDQLMGEAVVLDVSAKALRDRDYLISTEDVLEWEKVHGALEPNTIILFRTGYGKFYPDPLTYFGTELKGEAAIPNLHFPGVSQELALWLTKSRKVKAVGIDTPSIDYGQSKNFRAHQILLKENIPVFENVANLHLLKERGVYVIALPMLIEHGSGGPLRIIAGVQN
jgi:kynurenine formamidase